MSDIAKDVEIHRDWLLSMIPVHDGAAIVDLGCGTGRDLIALASRHPRGSVQFLGIDASEKSIAAASEQSRHDNRIRFQHHHLESQLPLPAASFDVVYSNNLLECLADARAFAREIARILRPGGTALIAHWDWDSQLFDGTDKARVRRLVHGFADWQQAWMDHSDGWMGRRLWGTFAPSALFDGDIHARVLTNTIFEAPWFGYSRAQDFRALVKRGLATAEDCDAFLQDQATLSAHNRYFYSITGYAYLGRCL
jgi:SAM-dependent methyltransferase